MKKIFLLVLLSSFFNGVLSAQTNEEKSKTFFEKAVALFDQQDYQLAISYCDSAIKFDTENLEAYAYRGVCKFHLGHYEDAIQDFDLALILNNGYAEVYYYRGLCKKELGADDQACSDWYEAYGLGFRKVMKLIESNCELETEEKK